MHQTNATISEVSTFEEILSAKSFHKLQTLTLEEERTKKTDNRFIREDVPMLVKLLFLSRYTIWLLFFFFEIGIYARKQQVRNANGAENGQRK